jgi:hypothetical protein
MQQIFKKSVPGIFALLALSFAVSVYSDHEVSTPVVHAAPASLSIAPPVKHENISRDYAQAHAELMKKSDEVAVNSF